tara:strand:+ start:261 stop:497 length:237 start_codon:yes stop_codon:yes gene_type:complete
MTEKIDWKKELLDSAKFNKKQESLLKDNEKSFTSNWLLNVLYTRWKMLNGIREKPSSDRTSSFQEWSKKVYNADKCQS